MAGVITALESQKRNSQRINVFIDQRFAFSLSRIVAAWLTVGQFLSDEKIEQLKQEDAIEVAMQSGLQLLSVRPRSEAELRGRLQTKGFSETVIESVITRLKQGGLVGDAEFARMWSEQRQALRQKSRKVIALELRQKGVTDEIVQEVLAESLPDDKVAYLAGKKYLRRIIHLEKSQFLQKMIGYLARRGFSYEVSRETAYRLWQEVSGGSSKSNGREELELWDSLDG
ncbi:regulatory protein RecX [Anaerolinea thermophila]|uniref:Regulatory protein RecX n=1 Tax=Anaerolinea thermophila (strain DSM 14523 / JCM 11388 / NBRC 100420 / UNI-1) TaxID=926569 RepID=E8N5C3_ANATU|nr:RecX family transcriptional regulator [Anaerolinea thermophila]BAJ63637.1 regulatory protein RecX [Anaerolinea thermophila UNI-1]